MTARGRHFLRSQWTAVGCESVFRLIPSSPVNNETNGCRNPTVDTTKDRDCVAFYSVIGDSFKFKRCDVKDVCENAQDMDSLIAVSLRSQCHCLGR